MRCILELCQGLDVVQYYEALEDGLDIQRLQHMKNEIESSSRTQCIRYKGVCRVLMRFTINFFEKIKG